MQVYQGLPILTAQPDLGEQDGILHHLFGHREVSKTYSVGKWLEEALSAIKVVRGKGKVPILAGGTGLYFEALTRGLAKIPEVDASAVAKADKFLQKHGMAALRDEVARIDPDAAARIQGADRHRLLRALSVYLHTGQSLSSFHGNTQPALAPGSWRAMALKPERQWLYARIEARFEMMIKQGALDEASTMARRNLPPDLPALKALGLKPLMEYMRGGMSLDEAREIAARATRHYAKRQFTWASGRFASWPVIDAMSPRQQNEQAFEIVNSAAIAAPEA